MGSSILAGEWHSGPGFRWAELDVPKQGKTGFSFLSADTTGIAFTNTLEEELGAANRVLYGGAGVAVAEFAGVASGKAA